jgi:hypothetical protein
VKVEEVNGNQKPNGAWQTQGNGHLQQSTVQSWSSLPSHRDAQTTASHDHSTSPMSTSYQMEEDRLHADKPSNRRHVSARNGYALHDREPEALSDSEDDEEFLRTHSSHLVKYMIDIHKRRKRVLEEYEHKREVSYNKRVDAILLQY